MSLALREEDQLADWRWRLSNLYWIVDERGQRVPFEPRPAQLDLLENLHGLDIILKARQLGFSTLVDLMMLDACVFNADQRAGIIAHNLQDVQVMFRDKVKFPYDNLDEAIRRANPATQDAANSLAFANNSSIRVGTSMRSGTLQYLHVSEYGKLCAKFPEKAREVRTGALNAVHAGQCLIIESTAEGQEGHFYELCEAARQLRDRDEPLSALDFRFHFYPWHLDDRYRMDPIRPETEEERAYFKRLETESGISLTKEQRAWYIAKATQQGEDMQREFPSTPDEAFAASIEGAYYASQFRKIDREQRICAVPPREGARVDTWWDLGLNDTMAIWWIQWVDRELHVLDYYENSGEGLAHYAEILTEKQKEREWLYGRHLWPHDGSHRVMDEHGRKRTEIMVGLGYRVEVMERGDVLDGIEASRDLLSISWFDRGHCSEGVKRLRHYRKQWDEERGTWKNRPLHDTNSHAADAFRTGAMAGPQERRHWDPLPLKVRKRV